MTLSLRRRVLAVASSAAVVAGVLVGAAPTEAARPTLERPASAAVGTARTTATQALAAVRSLFDAAPTRTSTSGHHAARPVDATMALLALSNQRAALSQQQRRVADTYLARPTDGKRDPQGEGYTTAEATPVCSATICIHYVATTSDKPSMKDADHDGVPDYVATTLAVVQHIHDTYIKAGYRSPEPDGTRGTGHGKIDIYLKDIGSQSIYGYCTSDPTKSRRRDQPAYCVFDNNFSAAEFGRRNTPVENLEVTAAHEYFHATQFAYDRYEDPWLLEATATWAEDEMYDRINDNLQYLPSSQLNFPLTPLDYFDPQGLEQYGAWSFIRFLTEKFRTDQAGMPTLVRQIFKLADARPRARNLYSWQAINAALRTHHTSAAKMYTAYVTANLRSRQTYAEGKANRYPQTQFLHTTISHAKHHRQIEFPLDHLTSLSTRFYPKGLSSKRSRLRLELHMAPTVRGSAGTYTVVTRSGRVKTGLVHLNRHGVGSKIVTFGNRTVRYVYLTAVNASGRFGRCHRNTLVSCGGYSKDDRLKLTMGATLLS